MSWDDKFSNLKQSVADKSAKAKQDEIDAAAQRVIDQTSAEKHVKEVILPIFEEVVASAKKHGFEAFLQVNNVEVVSGAKTGPFTKGAKLILKNPSAVRSIGRPGVPEAFLSIDYVAGKSFRTEYLTATHSGQTAGATIDAITKESIEKIIDELVASFNR